MHYVSTRGAAPTLGFADALIAGLARDGGLYLPLQVPELRRDAIRALRGLPYAEAAARVMTPFVGEDFGPAELETLTAAAYAGFRSRGRCASQRKSTTTSSRWSSSTDQRWRSRISPCSGSARR